jgi:hypothetical protein
MNVSSPPAGCARKERAARRRATSIAGSLLAALLWFPIDGNAQQPASAAFEGKADLALTSWGDPDIEGTWDFATITPMQRPNELAGKAFVTREEAAQLERSTHQRRVQNEAAPREGDVGNYNLGWWWDRRRWVPTLRTSLIIDPPDGRMPAMTGHAEARRKAREDARARTSGPEDLPPEERCIAGVNSGPPMIPGPYANLVQIHQSPGYVVIVNEMVHDSRIVPLDGRPHVNEAIRLPMGNSRGRWQGSTLVVETRNFRDLGNGHIGPTALVDRNLRLVERFSRTDRSTLVYEFTIDDPTIYVRPWTAQIPMMKVDAFVMEYACHEGNYGLVNILSGARALEKGASSKTER